MHWHSRYADKLLLAYCRNGSIRRMSVDKQNVKEKEMRRYFGVIKKQHSCLIVGHNSSSPVYHKNPVLVWLLWNHSCQQSQIYFLTVSQESQLLRSHLSPQSLNSLETCSKKQVYWVTWTRLQSKTSNLGRWLMFCLSSWFFLSYKPPKPTSWKSLDTCYRATRNSHIVIQGYYPWGCILHILVPLQIQMNSCTTNISQALRAPSVRTVVFK